MHCGCSRLSTPLSRAVAQVPRNLPQTATTNTASKATQRAGLLRLPMRVLKPLIAKNRGNSSRSTTVSSCCSSLRRNGA